MWPTIGDQGGYPLLDFGKYIVRWVSTVWFLGVGNPFLRSNWRNSAVLMIPQFLSKLNNEVMVEHRNFEDLMQEMDSPPLKTIP